MTPDARVAPRRVSARLRLASSYALFLVAAGFVTLLGVYVVLRYVPDYPLTAANPRDGSLNVASRQEILDAVVEVSGLILAAMALIGFTGGWFLAGRILRPLQQINRAAQLAARGDLDHRIRLTGPHDEFRQLADAFDHMLDRLHEAFLARERFAANASHELRTPLAVTETLLDVARRDPEGQDLGVLLERLAITNSRAIGLTTALLRLVDVEAVFSAAQSLDLAVVARSALAEHMEEAHHQGVVFDVRSSRTPMMGDAELVMQLASNLIQNAIRHNDARGEAVIRTHHDPQTSTATLSVENTGRTYTPEEAGRLHEPFLRGAVRINDAGSERGYGLGLALAARIVSVHGGGLDVAPLAGGGLIVTASLPDGLAESRRTATRQR